ncbi:hypothetical protein [Marinoscillum furvescens]|uniref:NigD-like protein n=1 Tax=Marinoscillum furvescens DSM 4134 TaxID=1122208 RepID=A0A3D9L8D4_MARFU|nr:hypothetical protein [Marinoscillum furvescens]REE02100.1 hypothetical protein C7460_102120 [Marinoscillum furvescens DSM 4134]
MKIQLHNILIVLYFTIVTFSCNNIESKVSNDEIEKPDLVYEGSKTEKDVILVSDIQSIGPALESSSIGIDPLMDNWANLPLLTDTLMMKLKFDYSDGNPIKLHSYKISNDSLFFIITVHEFVDMEKASHVGKLTVIKNNKLLGTIDVASFSELYSQRISYSIFDSDKKLRYQLQVYPEPEEVGELNTTIDSILILTKFIDLETLSILESSENWEELN